MTVFSGFLKSLKKSNWVTAMYVGIFLMLTLVSLSSLKKNVSDTFTISRPDVLVVNFSEGRKFDEALREQIESFGTFTTRDLSVAEVKDLIVGTAYDIAVLIRPDAEERLLSGEAPVFEVFFQDTDPAGVLAGMNLNRYLSYLDAYRKAHGEIDYSKVLKSSTEEIKVELLNDDQAISKTLFFRFYIRFFHYIYISLALFVMAPTLMAMNTGHLKARRGVSSLRPLDYFLQISLAIFVVVICFLAFFVLLGLGIVGFDLDYHVVSLLLLDLLVFSLALVAFTVFLSSLPISNVTISTVANVVSIVVAFTSGIFVPSEFLPDVINNLAKFFPAYYSVRITAVDTLTKNELLYNLGIQLLFAVVFALAAIYISRSRKTESLKVKSVAQ